MIKDTLNKVPNKPETRRDDHLFGIVLNCSYKARAGTARGNSGQSQVANRQVQFK